MKLPKQRGLWSPQGNRKARALDAVSAPYLRARAADGAEVRKSGSFMAVGKVPPDELVQLDGLYSIGLSTLVESTSTRKDFEASPAPAGQAYGYFRPGFAQVSQVGLLGTSMNFDGQPVSVYEITVSSVRGKGATTVQSTHLDAILSQEGNRLGSTTGARTLQVSSAAVTQNLVEGLKVSGGQLVPTARVLAADGVVNIDLPFATNQLNGHPQFAFFGPRDVVALCPSFTPDYFGSGINRGLTPGLLFYSSSDGGRSWSAQDMTPVFGPELASLKSVLIPRTGIVTPGWNNAISSALLRGYNPAPGLWMFLAVVPYAEPAGLSYVVKGRVKVGTRSLTSGEFTVTDVLFDGPIDDAFIFASAGAIEWRREGAPGILVFTRPAVADRPNQPRAVLWVTPASTASLGNMPRTNRNTGAVTAVSQSLLTCPMYDGDYALYVSNDGVEWRRRATIFESPVTPGAALNLPNFTFLTALRLRGRPALLTPQAPWASDYRRGND